MPSRHRYALPMPSRHRYALPMPSRYRYALPMPSRHRYALPMPSRHRYALPMPSRHRYALHMPLEFTPEDARTPRAARFAGGSTRSVPIPCSSTFRRLIHSGNNTFQVMTLQRLEIHRLTVAADMFTI